MIYNHAEDGTTTVTPFSSPQLAAIFITGQVLVAIGFNMALNSITLVQVPLDDDRFLDDGQLNWTLAIGPLVSLLGSLLSVSIAGRLGTRRLLMMALPVYALASLMVGFGGSFVLVFMGRFCMLMMLGMSEGSARGYAAEIMPPNRRAVTTAILNTLVFTTQAVALIVGKYVHWTSFFLIAGFLPVAICFAGLFFIPNSAKWLLSHGHSEEEARQSLHFFLGEHHNVDAEVGEIRDSVAHAHVDGEPIPAWKLVLRRGTLLPLLLSCVQMSAVVWTGGMGITFITSYILKPVRLPLDDYQSSMLPVALGAIVGIPASFAIERYGRLPLLRLSGIVSLGGCVAIATYFFLSPELQEKLGLVALVGAVAVQLAFCAFIAPISLVFINELIPNKTRMIGANIVMGWTYSQLFVLIKFYPTLRDAIGFSGIFLIHAAMSALQIPLATFGLPETSGLSLEQIQKLFEKRNKDVEVPLDVATDGDEDEVDNSTTDVAASKQM